MISIVRAREVLRLEAYGLGKGIYGATDALRLINFNRDMVDSSATVARQTIGRWVRSYDYEQDGQTRHVDPILRSDYDTGDLQDFELSFRDLIELRFVKAFRDLGLSLQTIRLCLERAATEVQDPRPFSTQKFRTDGKTIFLEITEGIQDPKLLDLKKRQGVFRSVVAPTFKDLEFDADVVARWYPLGKDRGSVIIDPSRSFGRPIAKSGIPTEVIRDAVAVEGSEEQVSRLYGISLAEVRDAAWFEERLAA